MAAQAADTLDAKLDGWKQIAAGSTPPVSIRTAQERFARNIDPLPVEHDATGRAWAWAAAIQQWCRREAARHAAEAAGGRIARLRSAAHRRLGGRKA